MSETTYLLPEVEKSGFSAKKIDPTARLRKMIPSNNKKLAHHLDSIGIGKSSIADSVDYDQSNPRLLCSSNSLSLIR